MLRSHQSMFVDICRQIKADEALRKVIALVCPGGGKSGLPVIAAHELIPYVADGIAWITPRSNLRTQAEEAFTNGWMRSILGHSNEIRQRKNEADLLLGKIGYATTYQSLIAARSYRPNPHITLFEQKRMILFLDEPQHVAVDEEFFAAVKPLVEKCTVLVMASGTLSRNDNKRIAFLDYLPKDRSGRYLVDLVGNRQQAIIKYGLRDATREHAIVKINFELRDFAGEWEIESEDGEIEDRKLDSFDGASKTDTGKLLYTALSTEFSKELLTEAVAFWRDHRRYNPRSTLLIVAPYIGHAEKAQRFLKKMGLNVGIATSGVSDDDDPQSTIDRFRQIEKPYLDALVTVAMAYEGMDAPQADVLVCLTHIRSPEWIEQMIHRVTRHDRKSSLPWEQQFATIFAPKDRFFIDIMQRIKLEQAPFVVEEPLGVPPKTPPKSQSKTHPKQSEMTERSAHTLDETPIMPDVHELVTKALKLADIHGAISTTSAKKFFDAMSAPAPMPEEKDDDVIIDVEPPSKREDKLRADIVRMQREGYDKSPESQERIKRRGAEIWKIFHKGVHAMTEKELEQVLAMESVWRVS